MKKFLLTAIALGSILGSWATTKQEQFPKAESVPDVYTVNLSQPNFKFFENTLTNSNVVSSLFPSITPSSQFNMGANFMASLDYDTYPEYADGIVCLSAGGFISNTVVRNEGNITNFQKGVSLYDFGNEIGQVLVFNGKDSKLAENIQSFFELENLPVIPTASQNFGAVLGFNWIQNKEIVNQAATNGQNGTVRIRLEVNIFNPNDNETLNTLTRINDNNNAIPGANSQVAINSRSFRQYSNDFNKSESDLGTLIEGSWNPYRWMVYDIEFRREAGVDLAKSLSALKMQIPANALNGAAILIRSIEMYFCPDNIEGIENTGKVTITYNDYTPDDEDKENPGTDPTPGPSEPELSGTDITPANYHFNTATNLPLHPEYISVKNIVNNSSDVYSDANLADSYEDGLIVVSTGGGQSAVEQANFRNALQLVNLGGEIGNVLFYGTSGSGIIDVLKNKAPSYASDWDNLSVNSSNNRNWQLNFFMPPTHTNTNSKYVHCKVIYNVVSSNSDLAGSPFLNIGMITNNNVADASNADSANLGLTDGDCFTNGEWDPTKWQVVEFDFNDTGNKPYRLRMDAKAANYWDKLALFIKDITFTEVEGTYSASNIKKSTVTYNDPFTYKLGDQIITKTKRLPVVSDLNDAIGFTLAFDGKLTQGSGDITVTTTENVTKKPEVKTSIDGKVLTVTLEGGDNAEYTVNIPEEYVYVSNHSYNAGVSRNVIIEGPKETTKEDIFPVAEQILSEFIDVTPSYYKFYEGNTVLDEMLRDDIKSPNQGNFGNGNSITANTGQGENWFTSEGLSKGNLILKSGAYWNDAAPLMKGISLFDFGGEVGKVFVINGKNSKLNEKIQEISGHKNAYNIPKMEANLGNLQLMWILDRDQMNSKIPQGNKVHVRMELNCYNNDMNTDADAITTLFFTDQQNNAKTLNPAAQIKEFTYRKGDSAAEGESYDATSTGEWNPNRWMVLDFEVDYNRIASYIRQYLVAANPDHSNGAWLIRSIEVYGLPTGYNSTLTPNNTTYKSWNDWDINVSEPTFEQFAEIPNEKSIEEDETPGEIVEDEANFEGFQGDTKHENIWTKENTSKKKYYFYNSQTGKNSELADDAVKIDEKSITISAPAEMGSELNHGVVRIQTGIKIVEGATYNFSTQAYKTAKLRTGEGAPEILVKLSSDGDSSAAGLANKTENGVHYLSNAALPAGNLILEVHFGGESNAGRDITLDNIVFAVNTESDLPDNPGTDPGEDQDPDYDYGEEVENAEQTVNQAMSFSSEGKITCGAMPELNDLDSYSIQFWVNPASWDEEAVLMKRGDSFIVKLGANNTVIFKNGANSVTASGFEPEEWNQVTLMVNKGAATILVNDEPGGEGTLGTLEETKRPFILGGGYKGMLDEVRLWNDALSNNDLMKRFDYFTHNTLNKWNPMWENLVAYYKMDQPTSPVMVEYKVIETKKADGTNNHGVLSEEGVKRVLANNDKMPYLVNAAYTENERFYDRLIPRDAYLLSNEIIVLGADCDATDGSVKTRLPNNHASVYGGVEHQASKGAQTNVAYFDGKEGTYLEAPASSTHSYKPDGKSDVTNTDLSNFTFQTRFFVDEWQPGAILLQKGNGDKGLEISMGGSDSAKTFVVKINGGSYTIAFDNYKNEMWNTFGLACGLNSRGNGYEFIISLNNEQQSYRSANSTIEDYSLTNVLNEPVKLGVGFKGWLDEILFNNSKLGIGMLQTYSNGLIVPTVEQGRNVAEMNAAGFGYKFDDPDNLGFNSYSQDYIANYIRSLYKGYSGAKVVLSVRGHNGSENTDDFTQIWGDDAKISKFATDLINAADSYDGVEFDLEWCLDQAAWNGLSKLSDAVEELLPEDKSFRISIHNAYYLFPKDKIENDKITGFTVQQYGPNKTYYPYSTFEKANKDLANYGYPENKTMLSFSTTMQGGGDIRGGAFANYELNDNDVDTYNGLSFMGPMQIFKRAKYAREKGYQGIFYWSMGSDLWLGSKDMSTGGVAHYEGMPEYNGAKYCSFGLNANIDRVVNSAKIKFPETEYAEGEEIEVPDLDDDFEQDPPEVENPEEGDTSNVESLDSSEYVNVYNINGMLVKKNVNKANLKQVLENGIYVIDGQKVIMK